MKILVEDSNGKPQGWLNTDGASHVLTPEFRQFIDDLQAGKLVSITGGEKKGDLQVDVARGVTHDNPELVAEALIAYGFIPRQEEA